MIAFRCNPSGNHCRASSVANPEKCQKFGFSVEYKRGRIVGVGRLAREILPAAKTGKLDATMSFRMSESPDAPANIRVENSGTVVPRGETIPNAVTATSRIMPPSY